MTNSKEKKKAAWFIVTEYHAHLTGYYMGEARDNLERAALRLEEISGLDSRATKDQIYNALLEHSADKKLLKCKNELTKMFRIRLYQASQILVRRKLIREAKKI